MRRRVHQLWALVLAALAVVLVAGVLPPSAVGVAHSTTVSDVQSAKTPQILDGKVTDLAEVGNRIVVTGTFTQVQNVTANGGNILNRASVFAFDPTTGAVDTPLPPAGTRAGKPPLPRPNATAYPGGGLSL